MMLKSVLPNDFLFAQKINIGIEIPVLYENSHEFLLLDDTEDTA